jgi:diaminobutyrate-2-oxoglutarate transaminase
VWQPGEHSGTFRGNNPAFVTGTAALRTYWRDGELEASVRAKGERIAAALGEIVRARPDLRLTVKGRGLARGLELSSGELANQVCRDVFKRGLLVETSGADGTVVKLLPPLTIEDDEIAQGLDVLVGAVARLPGRLQRVS